MLYHFPELGIIKVKVKTSLSANIPYRNYLNECDYNECDCYEHCIITCMFIFTAPK